MAVFMYGPNGEAQIFESAADAPAGWSDTFATFGGKPRVVTNGGGVQSVVIEGCQAAGVGQAPEPAKRGPGRPKTPEPNEAA